MDVYALPVPSGGPDLLLSPNVKELLGLSPESAYRNLTYQHLVEVNRVTFVLLQKWLLHCMVLLGIFPYCWLCADEYASMLKKTGWYDQVREQYRDPNVKVLKWDYTVSNTLYAIQVVLYSKSYTCSFHKCYYKILSSISYKLENFLWFKNFQMGFWYLKMALIHNLKIRK